MKKIIVGCTCLLSGVLLLGLSFIATARDGYVDLRRFDDVGFVLIVLAVIALVAGGILIIARGLKEKD
ncbi:MAG: hypothetical protein FWF05_02195 [Oscillospiraceae bacterium]|nr:hypothetical protein [Oscillospiraceae bacterium]